MTLYLDEQDPLPLGIFDALLAEYTPFADSNYILERLQLAYMRRLGKISSALPVAEQLQDALRSSSSDMQYRVLGDTVLRCTVQHAMRQIVTGEPYGLPLGICDEILHDTLAHVESGREGGLLDRATFSRARIGSEEWHGLIWDEDGSDNAFGRAFRFILRENYGETLVTPKPEELATIQLATALLDELMPATARSALKHAHTVGVFPSYGGWTGKASSSQYRVSGTIFLNREALRNPWWVAEHILHESLHQKLYDFRHGHLLLNRDSSIETEEAVTIEKPVRSIWNLPGITGLDLWDTHRALAAFHVYVHLSLLTTTAEQRSLELDTKFGPIKSTSPIMTGSRKCFERAHYLGESLKESCWGELGPAGQWMVDWLSSVLDALDPAPPPPGSFVHLLLDRYVLEIKHVAQTPQSAELTTLLEQLMEAELRSSRDILQQLAETAKLERMQAVVNERSDKGVIQRFQQTRLLVAQLLREATLDGYSFQETSSSSLDGPTEILRAMVERSSEALAAAMEGATAKESTHA